MKKNLKIVHVISNSPLAYPVPPSNQGGTEKVFYDLSEELVNRGHEVYVFAPKGSTGRAKVIEYPSYLKEQDIGRYVAWRIPTNIDIINDFTFSSSVKLQKLPTPTVSTHQCQLGWFTGKSIFPSKKMRSNVGKQSGHIVYNGINPHEYEYNEQKSDYLLFIGRIVREKGILEAIHVAEKTNHKLIIAGPIKDHKLFQEEIEPKIRSNKNIEYVGLVGGDRKQELFKNAKCALFPISWEEPFGLVMIEAMITGTPVLAFNRGAVPEVMAGFPQLICKNIDEMVQKVSDSSFPSSIKLRQYVIDRFSSEMMAEQYLKIYRNTINKKSFNGKINKLSKMKTAKRKKRTVEKSKK